MADFTISERHRVLTGPVINVDDLVITDPSGEQHARQVVVHPGAVSVVAVDDQRQVTLIRQYRAALGVELLEIPAGKRDVPGEDPVLTAQRELLEEVGLVAEEFSLLGEFHNSPGFSDEHSFVFLATRLQERPHNRQGAEEQHLSVLTIGLDDAPRLIANGEIRDAKTIIGLLLARERLGE